MHYIDRDGNATTLDKLCRDEPEWAANRIRKMQATLSRCMLLDPPGDCYAAEVVTLRAERDRLREVIERHRRRCVDTAGAADRELWAALEGK